MLKLFSTILLISSFFSLRAQNHNVAYFLDKALTKPCEPEKAKFSQTLLENEDSSVTTLVKDLSHHEVIFSETYKDQEAVGVWKVPCGKDFRELDYRFELVYNKVDCLNNLDKRLENISDYFADNPQQQFVAPRLKGQPFRVLDHIMKELFYLDEAKENQIQGTVHLAFTVDERGRVTDVRVEKGVHISLDKEAVRVFRELEFDSPAKLNGNNVALCIKVPVRIDLR